MERNRGRLYTVKEAKDKRGRKPLPPGQKAEWRSITLYPWEWDALAKAAHDGNATLEAQRRLRESLNACEKP